MKVKRFLKLMFGATLLCLAFGFTSAQGAVVSAPAHGITGTWSHDVHGCGNMTLWVPSPRAIADTAHPANLLPPTMRRTFQHSEVVKEAAEHHVNWLTKLVCHIEPDKRNDDSTSENWSGYQASSLTVTGVQFGWTVPGINVPSSKSGAVSVWPGIGNPSSNSDIAHTLIQDGSEEDSRCVPLTGCLDHTTSQTFWIELAPEQGQIDISNLAAHAGDSAASLAGYDPSSNTANFEICDYTDNFCGTASEALPAGGGSGTSAEWIVERTEFCTVVSCKYPSLNKFGRLNFTIAEYFNSDGTRTYMSASNPDQLTMTDCDSAATPLDRVEPISKKGNAFSIKWLAYGHSCKAG